MTKITTETEVEILDSRDLGLVLAQQLLDVEDLHYGLWGDDLPLTVGNIPVAQQRYTDMLLAALPPLPGQVRILDIGCGTGHLMAQMLDKGYAVDGLIPSHSLANKVRGRPQIRASTSSRVYECRLEDLGNEAHGNRYDVALFSESFQYIPIPAAFGQLQKLVKPGGLVIICDFFKTAANPEGTSGGNFGGGHPLESFYAQLKDAPFVILRDQDITEQVSPGLQLVDDLLQKRIAPACFTLGGYVKRRYPVLAWIIRKAFNAKLEKLRVKYLSGQRNKETFEKYKNYRFITLKYQPVESMGSDSIDI